MGCEWAEHLVGATIASTSELADTVRLEGDDHGSSSCIDNPPDSGLLTDRMDRSDEATRKSEVPRIASLMQFDARCWGN